MRLKLLIALCALFFAPAAHAQLFGPPLETVPKSYWKSLSWSGKRETRQQIKELERYREATKGRFDYYLEPPLPVPKGRILSGPAWHVEYLQAAQYEDKLDSLAEGRFCLAVMDTGEPSFNSLLEFKHPGHQSKSYTGEPVPDGHSHATHITGVYAHRDAEDHIGLLPGLAQSGRLTFAFYKVCTNGGGCSYPWIAEAVRDYIQFYKTELEPKGIRGGITLSLGGGSPNQSVTSAIEEALSEGIFVFASSGNNGRADISYPAEIQGVKAIGAHTRNGEKASFSNWAGVGEELYLVGPGASIYSTCKGNSKCYMSGTSMGNPAANAAVVAVAVARPGWSPEQVTNHVARYCQDLGEDGYDRKHGYGSPVFSGILGNLGKAPQEPNCSDGKQNGGEKGVDCGGPCPPCEESGKEFPQRILQVSLEGSWPVAWVENQRRSQSLYIGGALGFTQSGESVVFPDRQKTASWRWLDIEEITIRVKSKENASTAAAQMESLMDNIWTGSRGVGMAAPADFDKAGRTAAFFTDLLAREYFGGYDIAVEEILFSNRSGQSMSYGSGDLMQWPRGAPPFSGVPSGYGAAIHSPIDTAKTNPKAQRWAVTASWVREKQIQVKESAGLPARTFKLSDQAGVYKTYLESEDRPGEKLIEQNPPFGLPWKLGEVLKIESETFIKKP